MAERRKENSLFTIKGLSFNEDVYDVVRLLSHGRVTTYGVIARFLGDTRSSRRVCWTLNSSFGVEREVSAHRVVNRNGMLSGEMHLPPEKPMAEMLEKEGIEVKDGQVVNFDTVFWDPMTEL